jgi:hypothetical protein
MPVARPGVPVIAAAAVAIAGGLIEARSRATAARGKIDVERG